MKLADRLIPVVFVVIVAVSLASSLRVLAQDKPTEVKAPALTEVQKLQLQNTIQNVQLKAAAVQLAQNDFDKARASAQDFIKALQIPGYELNLETMTYTKVPPPPTDPKK